MNLRAKAYERGGQAAFCIFLSGLLIGFVGSVFEGAISVVAAVILGVLSFLLIRLAARHYEDMWLLIEYAMEAELNERTKEGNYRCVKS